MKLLLVSILIMSGVSSTLAADEVTVTLGGWSDHHVVCGKTECTFNEVHEIIGLTYNNWQVMTFKNSYHNRSTLLAYNWYLWDVALGSKVNVAVGIDLGVVRGYTESQVGSAYMGEGWSVFGLPKVDVTYKLSGDYSTGFSLGIIPSDHGIVYTSEIIFKIKL